MHKSHTQKTSPPKSINMRQYFTTELTDNEQLTNRKRTSKNDSIYPASLLQGYPQW